MKRSDLKKRAQRQVERDAIFGLSQDLPRLVEVNVSEVHANPHQPRQVFDEEKLDELAESIRKKGLVQLPVVKKRPEGGYYIAVGERRFRALLRMGAQTMPALLSDGDLAELALIENLQRVDLHPIEEAEGYQRLVEAHGYTQEELGQIVGKRQNTVSEVLGLLRLPDDVREQYLRSDVPRSVAIEISRAENEEEQRLLWEAARNGGLTVRSLRERRAARRGGQPVRERPGFVWQAKRLYRSLEKVPAGGLSIEAEAREELIRLRARIDELLTAGSEDGAGSPEA
jgi:ParB family chromosome partitioning protein